MTKLGKYISNLLGKEEGPIYYDHGIEEFRYEKNDKEVYPEVEVKKPINVQLQNLKEWSQNPKEYYAKEALKSYHQPTLPFKPEEIKPTKPKARERNPIPIAIPERHYEVKKEKSFEEYYQDRKNNEKKQGIGRYEPTKK